jgi:hypothetical protein
MASRRGGVPGGFAALTAGDPDGSGNGRRVRTPPTCASVGVQTRFMRSGTFRAFNPTFAGARPPRSGAGIQGAGCLPRLIRIPVLRPVDRCPRWDRRGRIVLRIRRSRQRRDRYDGHRHSKNNPEDKCERFPCPCHGLPPGARSMSLCRNLRRKRKRICDRRHTFVEIGRSYSAAGVPHGTSGTANP